MREFRGIVGSVHAAYFDIEIRIRIGCHFNAAARDCVSCVEIVKFAKRREIHAKSGVGDVFFAVFVIYAAV